MNGNQVNQIVADAYNHIWIDKHGYDYLAKSNLHLILVTVRSAPILPRMVLSCCVAFFPLLFVKQKMAIFIGAAFRVFAWLLHQTGWKERLVQ